ncbi:MAG: type II secretion system protein [Candidatus Gracilibacteria bacterium]
MKTSLKKSAFTLLEMIIAITVFTIFIGFAISTYLTFHRADQEALAMRSLMLETQGTMDVLIAAVKKNTIDYDYYGGDEDESTLALLSPDGKTHTIYAWDGTEKTLSVHTMDSDGKESEPTALHSETTSVNYMRFRIFPNANPYTLGPDAEDAQYYQPTVQMEVTFAMPGRIQEEVTVDFQTSVTSRFYQGSLPSIQGTKSLQELRWERRVLHAGFRTLLPLITLSSFQTFHSLGRIKPW